MMVASSTRVNPVSSTKGVVSATASESANLNSVKGVVLSGIFSPRMRPCVITAKLLNTAMNISCGMMDCSTEPFQTNSMRNQFSRGRTIMMRHPRP